MPGLKHSSPQHLLQINKNTSSRIDCNNLNLGVDTVNSATTFFLGSNTNEGFYSCFDELYNPDDDVRVFVIKGSAGCGKSTLMGRVAEYLLKRGFSCERVMCASDPESLDAIICESPDGAKLVMVDGTPPHVVEPKCYGAVEEIVNLGSALDTTALKAHSATLRRLFDASARCYKKTTSYLNAAALIMRNSKRIQDEYIDYEKIYNYVLGFAKRNFANKTGNGEVHYRFHTAVTPKGVITFSDGIINGYNQIISIDDKIGAVSGQILDCLLTVALDLGINTIAGVSTFDTEEISELLFPDHGIAIVLDNKNIKSTRKIHASRFVDTKGIKAHKQKLSFNKKMVDELRASAIKSLGDAKSIHDEIEKIYVSCANFKSTENMYKKLIAHVNSELFV